MPWARVRGVRRRHSRLVPDWIAWSQTVILEYESRDGRVRRLTIPPGMINLDQFFVLVQQKLAGTGQCVS
ncbi:MAG: hypothetical protein U1E76_15165 [Planctomycetota bacterium]